jgi:hypothetical protein
LITPAAELHLLADYIVFKRFFVNDHPSISVIGRRMCSAGFESLQQLLATAALAPHTPCQHAAYMYQLSTSSWYYQGMLGHMMAGAVGSRQ